MILRSLVELAEREGLLADTSYEQKPVDFFVHIGAGGKFLNLEAAPREAPGRDAKGRPKGTPKPPVRLISRRLERTAQDLAQFLVDKAEYVFGIDPSPDTKRDAAKLLARRSLFFNFVEEVRRDIPGSRGLAALSAFLTADPPVEIQSLLGGASELKPAELSGALFAFVFGPEGPDCIHDAPDVKAWWQRRVGDPAGKARGQCLVTGEPDAVLTRLHAKPKGIPPLAETRGGVPLTTVNQESFKSYGLDDLGGAPISERANLAVETALVRLLARNHLGPDGSPLARRNISVGSDTVLVYWSRREASIDFFSSMEADDPEAIAQMVRSASGANPAPIEDPTEFYALILSGKQGRAIVRSFVETTVRDVARNVERWREDGSIDRPFGRGPGGFSLRDILKSLVPRGELDKRPLSPALAGLYMAIVLGRPLPGAILESVVRRNRVELFREDRQGNPDVKPLAARSSLLKAWFQRNRGKEMPVSLDPDRREVAYRLGRLLATLDKVQADALGSVNATIVDRYFGSASATPASVFPTLIRRIQSHLSKLRREKAGLAVVRERLVQEIVSDIARFPKTLNLEDQGLFSLGFYQQRQAFFIKKEEN